MVEKPRQMIAAAPSPETELTPAASGRELVASLETIRRLLDELAPEIPADRPVLQERFVRLHSEVERAMRFCANETRAVPASGAVQTLPESEADRPKPGNGASSFKRATVLLVEDNVQTRNGCKTLLEASNQCEFVVLPCPNGSRALEVFGRCADEISLVLLDINLPDHDGVDLFHQMRSECPELKIIAMSGMPKQHIDDLFHEGSPDGVLEKPFDANELLQTVIEVLGP